MGPEQRLLGYDVQDKKFIDMQTERGRARTRQRTLTPP